MSFTLIITKLSECIHAVNKTWNQSKCCICDEWPQVKILSYMQYFYYMLCQATLVSHMTSRIDACHVNVSRWLSPGTGGLRLLDGDFINARLVDPVDDRVSQLAHQLDGANTWSAALTLVQWCHGWTWETGRIEVFFRCGFIPWWAPAPRSPGWESALWRSGLQGSWWEQETVK